MSMIKMQYRDWLIMYTREKLAATAFWGGNPLLSDFIRDKNGYEMAGCHYPANSLSQEDYKKTVLGMTEAEIEPFQIEAARRNALGL